MNLGTLNVEWVAHGLKISDSQANVIVLDEHEQRLLCDLILSRPRPPSSPSSASPSHCRWQSCVVKLASSSPSRSETGS
jgi:hypothetical protein